MNKRYGKIKNAVPLILCSCFSFGKERNSFLEEDNSSFYEKITSLFLDHAAFAMFLVAVAFPLAFS